MGELRPIVNFGSLNIDLVYSVESLVEVGQTISCTNFSKGPGGKGANQSVAISKAGGLVYHVGRVGSDGKFLVENLKRCGVQVEYIKVGKAPTGTAIIQVNSEGDNGIIVYGGANSEVDEEDVRLVLNAVKGITYVLIQNELPISSKVASLADAQGIPVVFNPSPMDQSLVEKFPWFTITFLIVNRTELDYLYHHLQINPSSHKNPNWTSLEKAQTVFQTILTLPNSKLQFLILTLGEEPTLILPKDQSYVQVDVPPLTEKVKDTTGAGDCFLGYFLATLNNLEVNRVDCVGWDWDLEKVKKAVQVANLAAGISVTRHGATQSIPSKNEVSERLSC